jgi:hypothetical protein
MKSATMKADETMSGYTTKVVLGRGWEQTIQTMGRPMGSLEEARSSARWFYNHGAVAVRIELNGKHVETAVR